MKRVQSSFVTLDVMVMNCKCCINMGLGMYSSNGAMRVVREVNPVGRYAFFSWWLAPLCYCGSSSTMFRSIATWSVDVLLWFLFSLAIILKEKLSFFVLWHVIWFKTVWYLQFKHNHRLLGVGCSVLDYSMFSKCWIWLVH